MRVYEVGFWGCFGFGLDICGVVILIVVLCFDLVGCLVGDCFVVSVGLVVLELPFAFLCGFRVACGCCCLILGWFA